MSCPPLIENPAVFLKELLVSKENRRVLIAIAGVPGAGKTTLADKIRNDYLALTGRDSSSIAVLSIDGFHKTRDELRRMKDPEESFRRRGAPFTFDGPGCASRIRDVKYNTDTDVKWPSFDHAEKDPVFDAITVSPKCDVVIIEGIWTLHRSDGFEALEGLFDQSWYLDTPRELSKTRLAERHMKAWGISREEADERIAINDGPNGDLVEQGRARADGLVLGN
jgi:pantothenate kinase